MWPESRRLLWVISGRVRDLWDVRFTNFPGVPSSRAGAESRFLCRGSPPGKLKVLDDGMQAARLGSVSHAVTSPGLPVASDSAARGALASS